MDSSTGDDTTGRTTGSSSVSLFAGLHLSNLPENTKTTIPAAAAAKTTTSFQVNPYDQTPRLSNISTSEKILFYDNDRVLPEAPSLKPVSPVTLSSGDSDDCRIVEAGATKSGNTSTDTSRSWSVLADNRGKDPKSSTIEMFEVKEEDDEMDENDNSRDKKGVERVPMVAVDSPSQHNSEEPIEEVFSEASATLTSSSPTLVFAKKQSHPRTESPLSPPLPTRKTSSADNMKKTSSERAPSSGAGVSDGISLGATGTGIIAGLSSTCTFASSPIPQSDICLAFLRKFVYKTEAHIPTTFGGIKATSLWQYVISPLASSGSISAKESEHLFNPYKEIVHLVFDDNHVRHKPDCKDISVDDISVLSVSASSHNSNSDSTVIEDGHKPSSSTNVTTALVATVGMTVPAVKEKEVSDIVRKRAAHSVALFIHLFNIWGNASSAYLESRNDMKGFAMFTELQASLFHTASNLVAYGCLDGVIISFSSTAGAEADICSPAAATHTSTVPTSTEEDCTTSPIMSSSSAEHHRAANMIVQSVFNSDLSVEKNELFAVKLLLGASCRVCSSGHDDSLVRGSFLLQSIRTLYHIYLTTESPSNKITARAALQQLVTNVFSKAVREPLRNSSSHTSKIDFPSENHRDAFLVLRSICKLSMRNLPTDANQRSNLAVQNHVSSSTKTLTDSKDGDQSKDESQINRSDSSLQATDGTSTRRNQEMELLISTSEIHPALESKLLALELILYILQNVDFASSNFTLYCGAQFLAAIRNYLCVSLLKNCTAASTKVVSLSLRIFVPTVRHFRTILKAEIEAFVTNVFFVILDSKNSSVEHKRLVVKTFSEICSDPTTLAEIFLNYDCDLSAVDLFHRIVNTLSKLSRFGYNLHDDNSKGAVGISSFFAIGASIANGPSEAQMEKVRNDSRALRLDAMRALRQILASLHASIVEPMQLRHQVQYYEANSSVRDCDTNLDDTRQEVLENRTEESISNGSIVKQNLVEIYGSKKKRRAEESEGVLRFNQKPSAGIAYLAKCGHLDDKDAADVARYLLNHKASLDKTQIGEYLGREPDYQSGFSIAVLHEYVRLLDFQGLVFDDAIRYFLSGFRLPGEAQKIDRIMEKFAERFTEQNVAVFPTADAAFILSFSIIMLNTDLHNPAIKEERRMTKDGFIRNNRGICDGKDLPEELLSSIFERIKSNPISLKEDDEAREKRKGDPKRSSTGLPTALTPVSFFSSHYAELDRARETNFQKERDHIVRTTESFLKRRRNGGQTHSVPAIGNDTSNNIKSVRSSRGRQSSRFVLSRDSGLRDEYVSPMYDVTWGPALAAFSTAIESANGTTLGALLQIATDEELELAAENAAEAIEVCLTGFRFAICTAGLCGNSIARDAYMLALSRFSQLGTGVLLEARHVRCVQTMFSLAREDGELLGGSWEHVFRALSEVNRYHQLFQLMARNDRAAARAAERRRLMIEAKEKRRKNRDERRAAQEDGESITEVASLDGSWGQSDDDDSLTELGLDGEDDYYMVYDDENLDAKGIDEANAKKVYSAVSETTIEAIYERSSSLSADAVKEFVIQLCQVSSSEIAVGNDRGDLNQVLYRQKHALSAGEFHHGQPNIYNLQKLVEVTHYNMDSRPRLLFSDIWVTVADHLTNVALHSNAAVAMYAVDSFRQLSIQYLKREELEVFEFQKRFLKPLETVMARSDQSSTKELLLNCVDRVIHVFRADGSSTRTKQREKGGLRSGWVPILNILGLGGRDPDNGIAQMSFNILSSEIRLCLCSTGYLEVLLADHFVETVQAVLMFIGGTHGDLSLMAIEHLVDLAQFLDDDSLIKSLSRRRTVDASEISRDTNVCTKSPDLLELWWPLLLGLSQSVGDDRNEVRSGALHALSNIINKYFFKDATVHTRDSIIQTLQLVFRGVLTPILEFAETSAVHSNPAPPLPEDFEIFLTNDESKRTRSISFDDYNPIYWLETSFDPLMDTCIALCLRAISDYQELTLVEEVFAILNSCLLSDSGTLAVRGLRRLEQFITSDLESKYLNDEVWATICHMLRRCLSVRGLPIKPAVLNQNNDSDEVHAEKRQKEAEYVAEIQEFVVQEGLVADRRYVGSNATMVVGLLLSSERFSVSLRWRLFLTAGLGRGIIEWERTSAILTPPNSPTLLTPNRPPDYRETAMYGRKWMNRLLLQLASIKEIAESPPDADPKTNRFATGQKLASDLTQGMLIAFVEKERLASKYRNSYGEKAVYVRITALVNELLVGYGNMDPMHLQKMYWLNPVLLSSCIQSKNEEIRLMVQKLVSRTSIPKDPPGKQQPVPPMKVEDPPGVTATLSNAANILGSDKDVGDLHSSVAVLESS